MTLTSYRPIVSMITLLFSFTHAYGATLLETPLATSQDSSFKHYWSGTKSQTSAALKVRLESLIENQKSRKYTPQKNINDYDSKINEVLKTLAYKK